MLFHKSPQHGGNGPSLGVVALHGSHHNPSVELAEIVPDIEAGYVDAMPPIRNICPQQRADDFGGVQGLVTSMKPSCTINTGDVFLQRGVHNIAS